MYTFSVCSRRWE